MTRGLHWFGNDLRLQDNAARADEWLPVFVLDPRIIGAPRAGEPRTRFLLDCLARLSRALEKRGVPLLVRSGTPEELLPKLMYETGARLLSFNEDTTPFALRRDAAVRREVERSGGEIVSGLDHVVFRSSEVRSASGGPCSVYTPYRNRWWQRWSEEPRLPIDWREGERFFFERLVDGDTASNNGGWQWAASTGTDAQPYFRIFDPVAQGRRWDPDGHYVRRWVPELREVPDHCVHALCESGQPPAAYPPVVVDHAERRALALERFSKVRQTGAKS